MSGKTEVTPAKPEGTEAQSFTIRVFELTTQKVRPMSLKVPGIETITVEAGTFESFKVILEHLDGEPGGGTFYISQTAPRYVIQSESKLPAMMGGGTVLKELQHIGSIDAE